jgi:hypothetical protein
MMNKPYRICVALALMLSTSAFGQTSKKSFDYDSAVDKLTTYSTVIGRALACKVDVSKQMDVVQDWFDNRVPKKYQAEFNSTFNIGVLYAAKQQVEGKSPDDCTTVRKHFNQIPLNKFSG